MLRSTRVLPLVLLAGCGGGNQHSDGGPCPSGSEQQGTVCINPPTMAAVRTPCGDVTEFCDPSATARPSLDCLTAAPKMHAATPAKVTLTGFVHPFSSGKSNAPVTIQIFRAADLAGGAPLASVTPVVPDTTIGFDPNTATDPTKFRACDADTKVGCVSVTPGACMAPPCTDGLSMRSDQPPEYCHTVSGVPTCSPRLRWEPRFTIPGVPTNTPLVIRSSAASTWATLVAWNVFLASDDKSCGGDPLATDCLDTSDMANPKYQLNVSVLSESDYFNIPFTAGLTSGISKGQGAVAGEVHDCDNVRLGNIQVGVSPAGDRFTYFNGSPYNTIPDPSRAATGTDRLGLYSSLNVAPGKITVEGVGLVDGKEVSVGKFEAVLYADSVAVVNLNGGKPVQ